MLLANVTGETLAIGNVWMPLLDGADVVGGYADGTIVSGPVCTAHAGEIELPAAHVQNYALRDGSCAMPPTCGGALPTCPALGELVLAPPG